ncbi:MAG: hypothetical protein HY529_01175 [Chloroflexi bacterium]|nr:hypothetical protein [Chloroflexota bacterium]
MTRKAILISGIIAGVALLAVALVACGQNLQPQVDKLTKENKILKEIVGEPPASLNKLFPPQSPTPVFLLGMFDLAMPFEGIGVDLGEGDIAGAKANFDAFKKQYIKMSDMVPEWKDKFPMAPVNTLEQALASGDPAKVGPAMGGVGKVCGDCHAINLVKVEQKYHWPSFDNVKLTDPVTKASQSFGDYMIGLDGAFVGAAIDLQEGQLDNARKNYDAFSARFQTLSTACAACHTTARAYFVDPTSQSMVEQLGKALKSTPPDGKAVGDLMQGIGNEICMKCHFVHLPAQTTKDLWEEVLPDLLK